ncbi:uncharacterized protein F5891DRAFT_1011535 [Suillus fuscotomentosus]|uniref:Uncharacterized protein n=1 Tax=Suillus fuscotomentosus TaxID=1912939 RepID=A0AAD4EGH0_9AGAM|nr:uncharacterized protein F5891DRAFT_1011535 [Suillus fuscotomentosus]KAG1904518.1 hypothetical protein F5891DRAFT_1011535 [Suillus fuscotomentosus]
MRFSPTSLVIPWISLLHCLYLVHFQNMAIMLDTHQHHSPPNPPPSILPQPSNPTYIDYQLGGPFRQIMHHPLSSMFLSRRVDCGTLQRVLPALKMTSYATKTTFLLLLPPIPAHAYGLATPDSMEEAGSVSASN